MGKKEEYYSFKHEWWLRVWDVVRGVVYKFMHT